MIGISSSSAGVLLLPKSGSREYTVLDVIRGKEQDPIEAQYLYSAAQDWEEIEGPDANALLETATQEYRLERTVSLLRLAIGGLESSLEKRVFEEVEEILGPRVSSEKVLDRLLVAPLADPSLPRGPAKFALSYGFSAVASICDELAELQPLLHRLTDLWLGMDEASFSKFSESRETVWVTLVKKCSMKQLLKAVSKHDFTAKWNLLAFCFPTPQSRSGVSILGQELAHRLFPHERQDEIITVSPMEESELEYSVEDKREVSIHKAFTRVEKQIAAIAKAVSEGHDMRADKFLRELIQDQISSTGGESLAVKSLCNIAQRCADMFRMDFEIICLDRARQLDPFDAWTLIQYGDHLKRVGNYDEALRVFDQAKQFGESDVASSSIADVYSQQGNYAKAILAYEAIPNWSDKAEVRTAIADNLRRMGHMEDAQKAYSELIGLAQQGLPEFVGSNIRAQAGIAEIAKIQGKLEEALKTYNGILAFKDVSDRDKRIYKLGLCNVLKLMEKFDQAYKVVDEVIQKYPFAMEARFIRGSILGLIGKELEGLKDLPQISGFGSWREWLRPYYRGLLLLKLERYKDAEKNLVEEFRNNVMASGEEKAILRMAAALYFLRGDETIEADGILSEIPDLQDCHAQYLSLVLKLHSATRKKDLAVMDSLKKQIAKIGIVDERLEKVVVALAENNFSLAISYEVDALLKLAA
jgi:tetratricopeptide (TPR) repeat protein